MPRLRIPFLGSLLHDASSDGAAAATGASTASSSSSSVAKGMDEEAALDGNGHANASYRKLRGAASSSAASPTRPLLAPGEKEADYGDGDEEDAFSDAYEEEESEIEDLEVFRVGRFAFSLTLLLFGALSVSLLVAGCLMFNEFLGKVLVGAGAALVAILVLMLLCGGEREADRGEGSEDGTAAGEAERRALLLDSKQYYSPRRGGDGGGGGGMRGSPQETASSSSSRRGSPAAPSRLV